MVNNDYRTMFNKVIGPILQYSGFYLNMDTGLIQQIGGNIGIKLSGKSLYVPENGEELLCVRESSIVVAFNPFKILEHLLILTKILCKSMSEKFMDELDEPEYDENGDIKDIVTLVRRGPKTEDRLPAPFLGVIYEIWCRNGEEILGTGIDLTGNDIRAILIVMLSALSKHSNLVDINPDFDKIFRYIDRVEKKKDDEYISAKAKFSKNLSQIDLSEPVSMESVELKDDETDEEDCSNTIKITGNAYDTIYDDLDF